MKSAATKYKGVSVLSDVVIKWSQCLVIFSEAEFRELVQSREDLWVTALRRGKEYVKSQQNVNSKQPLQPMRQE